jgi:hypothetical protein
MSPKPLKTTETSSKYSNSKSSSKTSVSKNFNLKIRHMKSRSIVLLSAEKISR